MRYIVWCPELGQSEEDGARITAAYEDTAVEEWAEWHDRSGAEYHIVGGNEHTVQAHNLDTGTVTEWTVVGRAVPSYTARRKR